MDSIVNMILGDSEFLDAVVVIRLVVFMFSLELFATVCGLLGSISRK